MPFPAEHFLLAFGGPLYTEDQWSMSLRSTVGGGVADNPAAHQVVLDAVKDVLATWFLSGAVPMGSQARLGWAKYNRVLPSGRYKHDETVRHDWDPVIGSTTAATHPPQIALVATLETGRARGLAHRGRIFLPIPRLPVSTDGRIVAQDANDVAAAVADLITDLNAVDGYGLTSVFSNVGSGQSSPITGVTVGRVLDTVRSRRTSIAEARSAPAAVAAGGA